MEEREVLGKCPKCGSDIVETDKGFLCTGWKEKGCKASIWKKNRDGEDITYGGVKLTKTHVKKLIEKGKIDKVKFKKKDESEYEDSLNLVENGEYLNIKIGWQIK